MRNAATRVRVFQPVRHVCVEALPAPAASVGPDHLCCDRSLVNEHQAPDIELGLLGLQLGKRGGDVRTGLLGGVESFF